MVGLLTSFLLFQYTKAKEDEFRISGFVVKDMALDEKTLDGQHIVAKYLLLDQKTTIISLGLINCGASGHVFIVENFARQKHFLLFKLKISYCLEVIDEKLMASVNETQIT